MESHNHPRPVETRHAPRKLSHSVTYKIQAYNHFNCFVASDIHFILFSFKCYSLSYLSSDSFISNIKNCFNIWEFLRKSLQRMFYCTACIIFTFKVVLQNILSLQKQKGSLVNTAMLSLYCCRGFIYQANRIVSYDCNYFVES